MHSNVGNSYLYDNNVNLPRPLVCTVCCYNYFLNIIRVRIIKLIPIFLILN